MNFLFIVICFLWKWMIKCSIQPAVVQELVNSLQFNERAWEVRHGINGRILAECIFRPFGTLVIVFAFKKMVSGITHLHYLSTYSQFIKSAIPSQHNHHFPIQSTKWTVLHTFPTLHNQSDFIMASPRCRPQVDLLFLIDATSSTKCTIQGIRAQCYDTTHDLRTKYPNIDARFGVVAYRDPVDCPSDKHDHLDFTSSYERLQSFLASVKSYGGRDDPEDLAGGIAIALDLSWRADAKKCIFLVTDANAHGTRFSGIDRDPHDDQTDRLVGLIRDIARRHIYMHAINIKKGPDPGAERTLTVLKNIYEGEGGPAFVVKEFSPRFHWQESHSGYREIEYPEEAASFDEDPADEGTDHEEMWQRESLDILRRTLKSQLMSSFSSGLSG
jgi:hypothetical protein